jgi:hypothetical protein
MNKDCVAAMAAASRRPKAERGGAVAGAERPHAPVAL